MKQYPKLWTKSDRKWVRDINTVNALHRLFIDASLVLIFAVACWYSMMGTGMGSIPKIIFALIVPIAISVVTINFFEVCHEYIQDVEKAKVTFDKYDKCTRDYKLRFRNGTTLERPAVSA